METNKERMLRVLSKFEKQIKVKDPDGEELEISIYYPSIKNSEDFWDIIYVLTKLKNKKDIDTNQEVQVELIKEIIPKINNFILKGYETKLERELTDEEKLYYSSLIFSNTIIIVNEFMDIATRMLGSGDEPKKSKAEVLPTE